MIAICQGYSRVICVPAGTALIYDSRTIHRGLANPSKASRPVLVFRYDYPATTIIITTIIIMIMIITITRYDYPATPPPGHTPLSTILYSCLGALLCAVGEAKLLLDAQ